MLSQSMRVCMQISPDLTICLPSLPHGSLRTKGKSLITKSHLKLSAPRSLTLGTLSSPTPNQEVIYTCSFLGERDITFLQKGGTESSNQSPGQALCSGSWATPNKLFFFVCLCYCLVAWCFCLLVDLFRARKYKTFYR